MATNVELDRALKDLPGYRGALGVDQLGPPLKEGESAIVNLQKSTEGGTHWVCASRQAPGYALYIDPYGPPPDDRVLRWLRKSGAMPLVNTAQYQANASDLCGWYCAYFLTELDKNRDVYRTLYTLLDVQPSARNERKIKQFRDTLQKQSTTMAGKGKKAASGVEGYCVKCRTKQVIQNPQEVVTKNARRMLKGTDAHGHTVCRILGNASTSGSGIKLPAGIKGGPHRRPRPPQSKGSGLHLP